MSKPKQKQTSQAKMPKILATSTSKSERPQATNEQKKLNDRQTKWVAFFIDNDNLYPNKIAERVRRSSTLARVISSITNIAFGDGFVFERNGEEITLEETDSRFQEFFKNVNVTDKKMSLRKLFKLCLSNYIMSGNNYLEVSKKDTKAGIVGNLKIHDFTTCRVNDDVCFISYFWRDIKNNSAYDNKLYPVNTIPLEGKNKNNYISHLKRHTPEYQYYGLPDFVGSFYDADIEYFIDRHNLGTLKKGFVAKTTITQVGDPPQGKTPKEYADDLRDKYSYRDNEYDDPENIVVHLVDSPEAAPIIHEHKLNMDGDFTKLEKSAFDGIIRGTGMFPALAGVEISGKLGSTTELLNEYAIIQNRCRVEYVEDVLEQLNDALEDLGFDIKIKEVVYSSPVSLHEFVSIKRILTKDEQRNEVGFPKLEDETEGSKFLEKESEQNGMV